MQLADMSSNMSSNISSNDRVYRKVVSLNLSIYQNLENLKGSAA
jgi:hypothetical protein